MLASAKALVLTHEMTDEKEWAPYAATVLQPLRPLTVYGRSAKMEPKVPSEHSIFYFWKDCSFADLIFFITCRCACFQIFAYTQQINCVAWSAKYYS